MNKSSKKFYVSLIDGSVFKLDAFNSKKWNTKLTNATKKHYKLVKAKSKIIKLSKRRLEGTKLYKHKVTFLWREVA